jgi:hypothetical protein
MGSLAGLRGVVKQRGNCECLLRFARPFRSLACYGASFLLSGRVISAMRAVPVSRPGRPVSPSQIATSTIDRNSVSLPDARPDVWSLFHKRAPPHRRSASAVHGYTISVIVREWDDFLMWPLIRMAALSGTEVLALSLDIRQLLGHLPFAHQTSPFLSARW